MKKNIFFSLSDHTALSQALSQNLKVDIGKIEMREFPDGESYIRIHSDVKDKTVILLYTLDHPNSKLLSLLFIARTMKDFGAKKICLVVPYLPYMRQDICFHSGEVITSRIFAELLSKWIDSMITIDPHLHRIHTLSDIYTIPDIVTLHATNIISDWILQHVSSPILIGPDAESKPLISKIASVANISFIIGEKKRVSDTQVILALPEIRDITQTPILIDDVISSGATMIEALHQVSARGLKKSLCIGIHALLNPQTERNLILAGAEKIITCNTIQHATNQIDVTPILVKGIIELCR